VLDGLGVAGAGAEAQREMAAQVGADRGDDQPAGGQQLAIPVPPGQPGQQRGAEQSRGAELPDRVYQADPLLMAVQGRPVSEAGRGGRRPRGEAYRDKSFRRPFCSLEKIQQNRRSPAAERQLDQGRVRGLAERDAVQRVGARPRGEGADHHIGQHTDRPVQRGCAFDAFGECRRPGCGKRGDYRERAPHRTGSVCAGSVPGQSIPASGDTAQQPAEGMPHALDRTRAPARLPPQPSAPEVMAASTSAWRSVSSTACSRSIRSAISSSSRISASRSLSAASITPRST
jgi:hypothetical protein